MHLSPPVHVPQAARELVYIMHGYSDSWRLAAARATVI